MVTLIFFSVSPAKRTVYTLTMYPALALIVGAGMDRFAALWPRFRRGFVWPLGALAVLAAIGVFLIPRQLERRAAELAPLGPDLGAWAIAAIALMAALACTLAIGAILLHRGRIAAAVAALGSGMGALALVAVFAILPRFDAIKSARALSRELVARAAPDEPYAFYPRLDATFLFYSERFAATSRESMRSRRSWRARSASGCWRDGTSGTSCRTARSSSRWRATPTSGRAIYC